MTAVRAVAGELPPGKHYLGVVKHQLTSRVVRDAAIDAFAGIDARTVRRAARVRVAVAISDGLGADFIAALAYGTRVCGWVVGRASRQAKNEWSTAFLRTC